MFYAKKARKFFEKNIMFASVLHAIGGLGLGIMLSRPLADGHPVRFGLVFILLAVLGHVWAATQ